MEPKFKPGFLFLFVIFVANMLLLGWLGGKVVDDNILPIVQLSTLFYFLFFIVVVPLYNFFEWRVLQIVAEENAIGVLTTLQPLGLRTEAGSSRGPTVLD